MRISHFDHRKQWQSSFRIMLAVLAQYLSAFCSYRLLQLELAQHYMSTMA